MKPFPFSICNSLHHLSGLFDFKFMSHLVITENNFAFPGNKFGNNSWEHNPRETNPSVERTIIEWTKSVLNSIQHWFYRAEVAVNVLNF